MYPILAILPLIVANSWHGFVLAHFKGPRRPDTLSEHACATPRFLAIHRIVHVSLSVCLIFFAVFYLWLQRSLAVPALVIILGSIFDAIEVLTLNKENAHHPLVVAPHQLTAWGMSFCYLAYGILITKAAGLPYLVVNSVWILFIVMISIAAFYRFRRFWISQMIYYSLLSFVSLIAHLKLLNI